MAGGTFITQNKVRPGVYVNFRSAPSAVGQASDRGICCLPIALPFGKEKELIPVTTESDFPGLFGAPLSDDRMLLIREVLKQAETCIVYRLNTGEKAAASGGGLEMSARYSGTAGNELTVSVALGTDQLYTVRTYWKGELKAECRAADAAAVEDNDFVIFAGSGSLSVSSGIALRGGTDGDATVKDYSDFMGAISLCEFHTAAFPVQEEEILSAAVSFVRRMRENEGKKCQVVLATDGKPDYEGVVTVKNGVVLEDGTTLAPQAATAFVAGALAGAQINESLTYRPYDGAVKAAPNYTNSQIESFLEEGYFVFTESGDRVVCEQDINSFTGFTPEKGKVFRKNRVIRVLDHIGNDLRSIFQTNYLGKISNNDTGRALFKAECIRYLETLEEMQAVTGFVPDEDIAVVRGADSENVVVNLYVQPVDSMERLYLSVEVS